MHIHPGGAVNTLNQATVKSAEIGSLKQRRHQVDALQNTFFVLGFALDNSFMAVAFSL
jgi:hypothetical protein